MLIGLRRLIPQLRHGGYLLADGNYDASPLYDLAFGQGYQLVAAHRKAKNPGSGHRYQSPRRLHPDVGVPVCPCEGGPEERGAFLPARLGTA